MKRIHLKNFLVMLLPVFIFMLFSPDYLLGR